MLPPTLRTKGRWLNVKPVVAWALKVIRFRQRQQRADKASDQLFGWLASYDKPLQETLKILTLLEEMSRQLKHQGLNRRQVSRCEWKARRLGLKGWAGRLGNLALAFLWDEVAAIPRGQTHLCSSDVIESLFGKYKAAVQRSPMHAITEMVLELATLTSSRTRETIRKAMEQVSAVDVKAWFKRNGEPTLLSKRREALT